MTARNWRDEYTRRVEWIRALLSESGAEGIAYGNSGGKDSALVGILCKAACDNTVGLIMPCGSKRNYHLDMEDVIFVVHISLLNLRLQKLKFRTVGLEAAIS
jgi:NAD+ synthase